VYYAYDMIYRTTTSPFRTLPATTTFNAAVFLVMRLVSREPPPGVSLATVLYLLAKQCMHAGAHKLARFAYNKLQTMVLPPAWQQEVDLQNLLVRWAACNIVQHSAT
jgi:intraflagellar transport protein 122